MATLLAEHAKLWFHMIQLDGGEAIGRRVVHHVLKAHELANVKDEKGRVATDMATPFNKEIIIEIFLLFKRYRLFELLHMSATCLVYRALDMKETDANGNPRQVALKVMRVKAQFMREISVRKYNLDKEFVIPILRTHPDSESLMDASSDVDPALMAEAASGNTTKDIIERFYILDMPLAERNMFVAIKQERFARNNWDEVRR